MCAGRSLDALAPHPMVYERTGGPGAGDRGGLTSARDRVQLSLNHLDAALLNLNLTLYLPAYVLV